MNGAETVTIKGIAETLEITRRVALKKANKENWSHTNGIRKVKLYYIDRLPEHIRVAVMALRVNNKLPALMTQGALPERAMVNPPGYPFLGRNHTPVPVGSPEMADWQNKTALAWADLIRAYAAEKKKTKARGQSVVEAAKVFIKGYNTGNLLPNIFAVIGKTSTGSVERNLKKFRDAGYDYTALAYRWGAHRGKRKVTNEEFNTILSFALHPNRLRISEVTRLTKMKFKKQGIESPSCEATLRRALRDWKNRNYDKWVFCREGEKALNDKCLPYNERDINALEVGDVLIADGHVLNYQILHPFTGKPCRMSMVMWYDWASCMPVGWEIMPTENVQCVAAGLRRAVLTLGKMPKVAYLDNGKAFKAKVFTDQTIDFEEAGFYGMFARLGIETIFAWPYNAQSKLIERFFGTFSELERLMPTYSGTSIENKPAHMNRNEKLHKQLHEKKYGGWMPSVQEANNIIAGWANSYAERPHKGIRGLCPGEILKTGQGPGVDEAELRYLMMSFDIKRVHRNGVSFMGRNYYDEALYGYRERVTVKYEFEDLSRVYIYDQTGSKLICEAKVVEKVHPVARLLGTKEDLALVKEGIRRKRDLKKTTEKIARTYVEQAPALISIPERMQSAEGMTHSVNEIAQGQGRRGQGKMIQLPRAEAEKIEAEAAQMKVLELKPKVQEPLYMSEPDRYEALLERECKGEALELDDMSFMRYFEKTAIYKTLKDRFDFLHDLFIAGPEPAYAEASAGDGKEIL